MRPQGQTFWLLNDDYFGKPENTIRSDGISAGESGLRLVADPNPASPAGLNSPDGSLGGLLLPEGMALDDSGILYLLAEGKRVLRFDVRTRSFHLLPGVGGGGVEARRFHDAPNIAIAGHDWYVADVGNHRVQVFALGTLALRHVWEVDAADVTSRGTVAYILDGANGRVYKHLAGTDELLPVVVEPGAAGKWSRIAVDLAGRIYLLDRGKPELDVYDPAGASLGAVSDAGDVRHRFPPPPIRLDYRNRFCLPESLLNLCRRSTAKSAVAEDPLALCRNSGLIFDRSGKPAQVQPAESPGPRIYAPAGTWISGPLDSQIYKCQWHRIVLHAPDIPSGAMIVVSTHSDLQALTAREILALPEEAWDGQYRAAGAMQQQGPSEQSREFLVQSREGQYLWLRIQFSGDGYETPSIDSVRVEYPRESYLAFLPAIYSADDEGRRFLERFLAVFQTEWDGIGKRIDEIAKYFDPKAVPAGPFMEHLAAWLDLPLEATWSDAQKRRLLEAAPRIYPKIGTLEGLREYLRIYLWNMTEAASQQQDAYPQILESFRERDHLMLSLPNVSALARLGHGAGMWSPGIVGRIQLGEFATEGQVALVSTGDPEHDIFLQYAHKFRVFVPSAWVATAGDERMLRRAIDAVKPAHAVYDLNLVEPGFRVGLQSTLGVDTILGDYPAARLGSAESEEVPPSRAPRGRLGIDMILGRAPTEPPAFRFAPAVRIGLDTTLN